MRRSDVVGAPEGAQAPVGIRAVSEKWNAYQKTRAIQAVLKAQRDFADTNALVEWAKAPGRRGVGKKALARLEAARDALGRRVLKMVEAMPADMFRRKAAR